MSKRYLEGMIVEFHPNVAREYNIKNGLGVITQVKENGTFPYRIKVESSNIEGDLRDFPTQKSEFELTNKRLYNILEGWRKENMINDKQIK